jgi:succinate dehydrogenase hydrophobic anchor subunit
MLEQMSVKVNRMLGLHYTGAEADALWLRNGDALRRLVGMLGMLLPLLLPAALWLDSGRTAPLESISHYYFTRVSSILVIILSLMAIFLLVYKGFKPVDFYLSSLAGISALCIILFPTTNLPGCCYNCVLTNGVAVTWLKQSDLRTTFHYISAGIFLLLLAIMLFFLFTRLDRPVNERKHKKLRNHIYRICAVVMLLSILVIFLQFIGFGLVSDAVYNASHLTFWMEAVAVESFGIGWMVKGNTVLRG